MRTPVVGTRFLAGFLTLFAVFHFALGWITCAQIQHRRATPAIPAVYFVDVELPPLPTCTGALAPAREAGDAR